MSQTPTIAMGGARAGAGPAIPAAVASEVPRILDTYSAVYAFTLLFLLPGMVALNRMPFGDDRSTIYTFGYVSSVAVPFLLGLVATFALDSRDGVKRTLLRIAVLTPLVVVTGVTVMFLASAIMIPASKFLGIADQGLTVLWWAGLAAVAAPLFISMARLIRSPEGWRGVVRLVAIVAAICVVIALAVFSFAVEANIYELWRKDVVIYVVGALSWYLPSFGIAAGFWRHTGLV